MKEKDPKPIQELAMAEAKAGVDYIDINLGPARKGGGELMEWIVKIVQEVVDTPLYLDTINAEAIEAGLKVYKNKKGKGGDQFDHGPAREHGREIPARPEVRRRLGRSPLGPLRPPQGCRGKGSARGGIDAEGHRIRHPGRGHLDGSDRHPGDQPAEPGSGPQLRRVYEDVQRPPGGLPRA